VLLSNERAGDSLSVFRLRHSILVGVESVNRPLDHIAARRIMQSGKSISRSQLLDFNLDLKALLARITNTVSGANA
jgi:3-phenylpropionate/trans-cinnamate dioxygenase ferredoxin reductase subunit